MTAQTRTRGNLRAIGHHGDGRRPAGDGGWRHGPGVSPALPAEVTVCVSRGGSRPVVTVTGALDLSGASLLSAMLEHVRQTEGPAVEVDLGAVDYADSHGLAPLLDGRVTIQRASRIVRRLFAALQRPLPRAT